MDRQPTLESERLLVRPLRQDDREALYAFVGDSLLWQQHPVPERAERVHFDDWFDGLLGHGGAMVAIERASGTAIATSSFLNHRTEGEGVIEVGSTAVARSHWGGWANRELKRLMLSHAFASVGCVEFLIGEHNMRSRRAVEKIGGVLTDRIHIAEYRGREIPHLIYELTRADFAKGPLSRAGFASSANSARGRRSRG
ncbi:MAG: GNAT family protein [Sphingomonadaceae bacterium]|jgi:RimJ/RimL family protein N-acetyltransferase